MKPYNSYHTCIKQLARSNALPQKYSSCIDRSTLWRWKHENEDKYLGSELSSIQTLQEFLERRESDTLIRGYLKITLALSSIIQKNQVPYPCKTSVLELCRRIYPIQLSKMETFQLTSLLTDSAFRYWPVCSIVHYARRNNILRISLSTWYNYISKLGIKRPILPRKPRYKIGIRASRPHEIWHAYRGYLIEPENDTKILVDGGPENNNCLVEHYINKESISLQKLIAGKDIHFSNSMIEAQNKLIKYHYLFKHQFQNLDELTKLLDWIFKDYNHRRPHHSLGGLTPAEALNGTIPHKNEWKQQSKDARESRILENTSKPCGIC